MIYKTKHINYLYTIKTFPAQNTLYSTNENPISVDQKLNCVHECKQNINQPMNKTVILSKNEAVHNIYHEVYLNKSPTEDCQWWCFRNWKKVTFFILKTLMKYIYWVYLP